MPQIQFNDDGVWHDFAPRDEKDYEYHEYVKAGLHAPLFPYVKLQSGDEVCDFKSENHSTREKNAFAKAAAKDAERAAEEKAVAKKAAEEEAAAEAAATRRAAAKAEAEQAAAEEADAFALRAEMEKSQLPSHEWYSNEQGELFDGQPCCKQSGDEVAFFKHERGMNNGDVMKMKVVKGEPAVGFAGTAAEVLAFFVCLHDWLFFFCLQLSLVRLLRPP
jgi:hypothetical protein